MILRQQGYMRSYCDRSTRGVMFIVTHFVKPTLNGNNVPDLVLYSFLFCSFSFPLRFLFAFLLHVCFFLDFPILDFSLSRFPSSCCLLFSCLSFYFSLFCILCGYLFCPHLLLVYSLYFFLWFPVFNMSHDYRKYNIKFVVINIWHDPIIKLSMLNRVSFIKILFVNLTNILYLGTFHKKYQKFVTINVMIFFRKITHDHSRSECLQSKIHRSKNIQKYINIQNEVFVVIFKVWKALLLRF